MARRARARSFAGAAGVFAAMCIGLAVSAAAQDVSGAVLTIDPERLFEESMFGARVREEAEAEAAALQSENRRIEAELTAEERDLTERRPGLPVDDFRALADAFDAKVDQIRAEQDQKARDIQETREAEQQDFLNQIGPILLGLVQERQASILLDRRAVFLSAGSVDLTDEAIARINAEIGTGMGEAER
ncbi:MAG: OmpH family outer membrane protein [Pseudomonadota bacterium]